MPFRRGVYKALDEVRLEGSGQGAEIRTQNHGAHEVAELLAGWERSGRLGQGRFDSGEAGFLKKTGGILRGGEPEGPGPRIRGKGGRRGDLVGKTVRPFQITGAAALRDHQSAS